MKYELKRLQESDSITLYDFFANLPDENGNVKEHYMSKSEFAEIVKKRIDNVDGSKLQNSDFPEILYIFYVNDIPVGFVKLRPKLTFKLKMRGGNISYGLLKKYWGLGYAKIMLGEVLKCAKKMGLKRVLLTSYDDNIPSWKVMEHNNAVLTKTVPEQHSGKLVRHYWIEIENQINKKLKEKEFEK